ncbi:amino acid transporter [Polychaeton citri CBS 116435]|uniref:Amino acid transporter n=1 Tax=Polychaeton citri CBS 116435 TaxID=1314669 RepID=A0A9P4QEM6_9PEZI|nr:amino acid transporter [Polychaeton citri CBS 116435]
MNADCDSQIGSVSNKPFEKFSISEVADDELAKVSHHKGSSQADDSDMRRMGRAQELRRNFKFVGIVGFVTILQATWECTLLATWPGLFNGGTAGVIFCTIGVWFGMMCLIASMGELASMAPNSGGQYHWVSEFAPPALQKPLSYIVGWSSALGWIAGVPSCGIQLAGIVQEMIILTMPNAKFTELWQITLVIFLVIMLTVGFNIFLGHHLPMAEGIILFVHVFGFFAFLLTFWIMGEPAPASDVFGQFYNGGGWPSTGLSCLVGLTTPIWCFVGADAGAHMSEELRDASIQLPRAMMWSIFINGIMGITMLITFCFFIGDVSKFVEIDTDYPIIVVLYKVTGSLAGTMALGVVLVILLFFSTVTTVASSSRQIWSFARDQGFPYSKWIRQVRPGWDLPVNALLVCLGVSLVLAAINFGSPDALNAILSVSNAALLFSYIISVGALRLRRLQGYPLLPRRWSLGRFGPIINDLTLAFLVISFFFAFWPTAVLTNDPTAAVDFNYSIVVFAIVFTAAFSYYFLGGRYKYVAPVALVKAD